MRNDKLVTRTVASTVAFVLFMILFGPVMDAVAGRPISVVGTVVSTSVGALVYGILNYVFMRRRGTANGG